MIVYGTICYTVNPVLLGNPSYHTCVENHISPILNRQRSYFNGGRSDVSSNLYRLIHAIFTTLACHSQRQTPGLLHASYLWRQSLSSTSLASWRDSAEKETMITS